MKGLKKYGKLVRDNIPDIMMAKGQVSVTHFATPEEYAAKLDEKLLEEATEFFESRDPEELADILEVVYALAATRGITKENLEALRKKKAEERGGFEKHIILDEA